MRITVAQRLTPFSHIAGTTCMLPGSPWRLQIFPALIRVHDLSLAEPLLIAELHLNIKGPVKGFTVQQDLEKGIIKVWGETPSGFMRYRLAYLSKEKALAIAIEKDLDPKITFTTADKLSIRIGNEREEILPTERLSLGVHKSQDWELVSRRNNMAEIFPFWMRLGLLTSDIPLLPLEGTATFLDACKKAVESRTPDLILKPFCDLYQAGFQGMLSPRLVDDQHQGFSIPLLNPNSHLSPLILLKQGALLIRSLFLQSPNNGETAILPALPSQFHSGRLINVGCPNGFLDLEWTKKLIRRIIYRPTRNGEVLFSFQKELKSFRVREGNKDRGKRVSCGTALNFSEGCTYFLDNLQK